MVPTASSCECKLKNEYHSKTVVYSADLQEDGIDISDSTFSIKIGGAWSGKCGGWYSGSCNETEDNSMFLSKYSILPTEY